MLSIQIYVHENGPKYFELNFLTILKIICSVCSRMSTHQLKIYNKEHPLNVLGKDMNVSFCGVQGWVLDLLWDLWDLVLYNCSKHSQQLWS